jgi:hypothetical protein
MIMKEKKKHEGMMMTHVCFAYALRMFVKHITVSFCASANVSVKKKETNYSFLRIYIYKRKKQHKVIYNHLKLVA